MTAYQPYLGTLVSPALRGEANSRLRFSEALAQIAAPGLGGALARVVHAARVIQHHVAQRAQHVPARIHVVADKCEPVGRQVLLAEGQQGFARIGRHPGIDAVRDDVIEFPQCRRRAQVETCQTDVAQPHGPGCRLSGLNLPGRVIKTHEAGAGQAERHGQQVGSRGTAHFQHPAARHRRRL